MTAPLTLRLIEPEQPPFADPAASPEIHVRTLATPPAAPWEQGRAARLDAQLSTPLPIADLVWKVQRLSPWRPGEPSRWAVFYARADAVGEGLTCVLEVEGRPWRVTFASAVRRAQVARRTAAIALVAAVVITTLVGGVVAALTVRSGSDNRLQTLEQMATLGVEDAQRQARAHRQQAALAAEGLQGRTVNVFLRDLAWVSAAKAPDTRIQALHWERGVLGVEVRGDGEPFTKIDRGIKRFDKRLPFGVRLWAVAPDDATPNSTSEP